MLSCVVLCQTWNWVCLTRACSFSTLFWPWDSPLFCQYCPYSWSTVNQWLMRCNWFQAISLGHSLKGMSNQDQPIIISCAWLSVRQLSLDKHRLEHASCDNFSFVFPMNSDEPHGIPCRNGKLIWFPCWFTFMRLSAAQQGAVSCIFMKVKAICCTVAQCAPFMLFLFFSVALASVSLKCSWRGASSL